MQAGQLTAGNCGLCGLTVIDVDFSLLQITSVRPPSHHKVCTCEDYTKRRWVKLRVADSTIEIRSRWNRDRYICIPIILKRYNVSMKPWSLHLYPCWTVSIVNRRHRHIIACWCIAALTAMTKRTKADMVLLHITNRKKNLRINTQMLAVASCTRWRGLRPSVARVQILWPCVRTQGLQAAPRQWRRRWRHNDTETQIAKGIAKTQIAKVSVQNQFSVFFLYKHTLCGEKYIWCIYIYIPTAI